jgi:nucleotide-binding universal stress UspA family protein
MPFANTMVVYDGTAEGDELLDMVCRIARAHRARLTILHIKLVPLKEPLPQYAHGIDAQIDEAVSRGEKLADSRGVKAASAVRYARAVGAAILNEARVRGIDLIAMLTPEPAKLPAGTCLSPDIEAVLQKAACPMLLYRPCR